MPMLKDPPEHPAEHSPEHAPDQPPQQPPEHGPQPLTGLGTLDTSRGNRDGFAIASRYGRRASRNFAVRRNSRP